MKSIITVQSDNLIYTVLQDITEKEIDEWTSNLYDTVKKQFDNVGPVKILTDLTNITFADSLKIRNDVSEMEKKNKPYVLKSAAFSADLKLRWLAMIIAKMSGRANFAILKTKEDAIFWLNYPSKNLVLKETFYLAYNFMKENPDADEVDVLNHVRGLRKYANEEGEVIVDFFNLQQGTVYVTYNYVKEEKKIKREEAFEYIEKNYDDLLDKYYLLEP